MGLMDSGGLGVALPSASAKRSRLFQEVVDDCSHGGRRLSPCGGAIIKEMNESAFALIFLETGNTPSSPLTWHHQQFAVSTP